jgi:hypothetical protein
MEKTEANKKNALKRDICIGLAAQFSRSRKDLEKKAQFLQLIAVGKSLADACHETRVALGTSYHMLLEIHRYLSRLPEDQKSILLRSVHIAIQKAL